MKFKATCFIIAFCISQNVGAAVSKPDFNGTWVLDRDRSFSNPPGLEQTLVIVHSGDRIQLDSKIKTDRGETQVSETYTLDGKETDFTPSGGQPDAKGKRDAHWLPDGRGIVINDSVTASSPKGPVVNRVTRKWTLSSDGSTLTVDYYFDDQRGSFEAKRVFVKK